MDAKRIAGQYWSLAQYGVYTPSCHLREVVLIDGDGERSLTGRTTWYYHSIHVA